MNTFDHNIISRGRQNNVGLLRGWERTLRMRGGGEGGGVHVPTQTCRLQCSWRIWIDVPFHDLFYVQVLWSACFVRRVNILVINVKHWISSWALQRDLITCDVSWVIGEMEELPEYSSYHNYIDVYYNVYIICTILCTNIIGAYEYVQANNG